MLAAAIAATSAQALPLGGAVDFDDPISWDEGAPERLPLGGSATFAAAIVGSSAAALPLDGSVIVSSGAAPSSSIPGGARRRATVRVVAFHGALARPELRQAVILVQNPPVRRALAGANLRARYTFALRGGTLVVAPLQAITVAQFTLTGLLSLPPLAIEGRMLATEPTAIERLIVLGLGEVFLA